MPKRFEQLLQSRRIFRQEVSQNDVRRGLERAERDLRTARRIMIEDWDWGFAVAYNAVLQVSRSFMYAQGYRPASNQSHKNTFAFMQLAMSEEYKDLITYFDRMRNKRNQVIYDVAGLITETEAKYLLSKAEGFVMTIREKLASSS